jgi:hypothetical protein
MRLRVQEKTGNTANAINDGLIAGHRTVDHVWKDVNN